MPFQVDSQGIITEGRFQGHHIENVASYAESLEETIKAGASMFARGLLGLIILAAILRGFV